MASATLRLIRPGYMSMRGGLPFGSYDILLDGKVAGSIAMGQTEELPVEPGRHTLRLKSGRQTSRERAFDVRDGEEVNFSCRGALLWPIYLASFIKPDLCIKLKQE